MPTFFKSISESLSTIPYQSSVSQRNAQRASGITQVVASSIQLLAPPAAIPAKFAQFIIASYTIFREDTHLSEKGLLFLQAMVALTQLGLSITVLFQDKDCYNEDKSNRLCTTIFLFDMVYAGLLSAIWSMSELAKERAVLPATAAQTAENKNDDTTQNASMGV